MDAKSDFLNNILADMQYVLTPEQIEMLRSSILKQLRFTIITKQTQLMKYENFDISDRAIKLFVASRRLEGLSENTIKYYVYETKRFLTAINKNIYQVSAIDVQYYLSEFEKERHVSRRSLDNMRRAINGIYIWLADNDYIDKNPLSSLRPIAFEKKPIEILTDDEIFSIRECCRNDIRLRAIIELLLATGVRVSELISINIEDINFDTNEVLIHCAKKRRKEDRILFLTVEAKRCLYNYLEYRNTLDSRDGTALFISNRNHGRRCTERLVNTSLREIEKNTGIKKKLTVHIFRRTLASILFRRGMSSFEISKILGHADARMSETYYIGVQNEDIKRNYYRYR